MGVFSACSKLFMFLALVVAVIVGWFMAQECPIGTFFAVAYKLMGYGKPPTELVPDSQTPVSRPEGEMFLPLPSGDKMPANGIGMCCRPTAYDPESVYNTVLWYLLLGGRHIDTAYLYLNHKPIGKAIEEAMRRGVPRSEIFVTTKLHPGLYGYNSTLQEVPQMLKDLRVDYIDLMLLHSPRKLHLSYLWHVKMGGPDEFSSHECKNHVKCRKDSWTALSELKDRGLIKNLGVSNFKVSHMKEIQALGLAPIAVHQLQFHPWLPQWLKDVVSYCHKNSIALTGYFSLGGYTNKDKTTDMDVLTEIAKAHGKRPAQILLRWSLHKNVSIIPGTGNPKHMKDNLATYSFKLTDEEIARIDAMEEHPVSKDLDLFFLDL